MDYKLQNNGIYNPLIRSPLILTSWSIQVESIQTLNRTLPSWWFSTHLKNIRQNGNPSSGRGEHKKSLKPPHSYQRTPKLRSSYWILRFFRGRFRNGPVRDYWIEAGLNQAMSWPVKTTPPRRKQPALWSGLVKHWFPLPFHTGFLEN